MADRNIEMKIAYATNRKNTIQELINKDKEEISKIEEKISRNEDLILKIDNDINKLRVIAQRQNDIESKSQENNINMDRNDITSSVQEEDAPVGDASTTTASLDASSQSGGGYKSGWKFYDKVGSKHKKKTKKVRDYVSRFTETLSYDDETEIIEEEV